MAKRWGKFVLFVERRGIFVEASINKHSRETFDASQNVNPSILETFAAKATNEIGGKVENWIGEFFRRWRNLKISTKILRH